MTATAELEGALVASAVNITGSFDLLAGSVEACWFSDQRWGDAWRGMEALRAAGDSIDTISLINVMRTRGMDDSDQLIGIELTRFEMIHIPKANYQQHAGELHRAYQVRQLSAMATALDFATRQPGADASALAADLDSSLSELMTSSAGGGLRPVLGCVRDAFEGFEESISRHKRGAGCMGVTTGLPDVDRFTDGIHKGRLTLVAGRPAMGKTSLALCVARGALHRGESVGIFSLEMSAAEVAATLLCQESRVDQTAIREDRATRQDWGALSTAAHWISDQRLYIDDRADITVAAMRAEVRRVQRDGGLDLVVVDYLQLMEGSGGRSRERDVAEISRGIKVMAKDLDVAALAVSQLNRGVEARTVKRPMLSDLRESGALEQDADLIMFVHRPEYYEPENQQLRGVADLIVAKNRFGQTGTVTLRWTGACTRFDCVERNSDREGWADSHEGY